MAPPRTAADWRANRPRPAVADGYVVRDGVRIFWEAFGAGEPAILMLPTWSVVHAAHGRFQIADLARHHRVVTFDPRGNGRSDRPAGPDAYDDREFVADALAVLDASGTERAVVVGCSQATYWLLGPRRGPPGSRARGGRQRHEPAARPRAPHGGRGAAVRRPGHLHWTAGPSGTRRTGGTTTRASCASSSPRSGTSRTRRR